MQKEAVFTPGVALSLVPAFFALAIATNRSHLGWPGTPKQRFYLMMFFGIASVLELAVICPLVAYGARRRGYGADDRPVERVFVFFAAIGPVLSPFWLFLEFLLLFVGNR